MKVDQNKPPPSGEARREKLEAALIPRSCRLRLRAGQGPGAGVTRGLRLGSPGRAVSCPASGASAHRLVCPAPGLGAGRPGHVPFTPAPVSSALSGREALLPATLSEGRAFLRNVICLQTPGRAGVRPAAPSLRAGLPHRRASREGSSGRSVGV